jgi:hypothetical protein
VVKLRNRLARASGAFEDFYDYKVGQLDFFRFFWVTLGFRFNPKP